jgi:hypothetical protein
MGTFSGTATFTAANGDELLADSATGDENFLADTAHRNTMSYGFFDGENTLLTGNAKQLDDLVEDDVFRASVTMLGRWTRTPR